MADDKDEKKIVKLPEPGKRKPLTIGTLLESREVQSRMQQIVPKYASPDQLLRLCLLATHQRPLLLECNAMTLLGAMMSCASLGFAPNTQLGLAYLIPFKNRQKGTVDVQLIIGYKGFVDLMWRSGRLTALHTDVVFKGDDFDYEYGSNMHLRHKPKGGASEKREPTDAYCFLRLKNDEGFTVMSYPDILRIRNKSEGYRSGKSPWLTDEYEMSKKTTLRRHVKLVQISPEVDRAVSLDTRAESQKIDFVAAAEDPEMIGYDAGDDDAKDDADEGAETRDGDNHKEAPAHNENLARSETSKPTAKPVKAETKPQGRRSFFGDDA